MASHIQLLHESVSHMIAAGEVVEGPHSVVKELVENSLDAGSVSIDIEAEDSGFSRIVIRDNGEGIYREDLPRAVMEHATSKIRTIEDIQSIHSLGFRGEALSSIGAVAKLTMMSRRADEETGGKITNASGSFELTDFAGAVGTTVIVENLFYNTPARKKFMRAPAAESRAIREAVQRAALAHYAVQFSLSINGTTVFRLAACDNTGQRVEQIFGREDFSSMAFESVKDIKVSVEGFLSRPHHSKGTRAMQYLFVNGRPVDMKSLGFLLSRAYESATPQGRYPAAILFLSIAPDLVDVNIHPAKREIKFFDQRYVEQLISGLAKKTLGSREQTVTASDFLGTPSSEKTIEREVYSSRSVPSPDMDISAAPHFSSQRQFSFPPVREAPVAHGFQPEASVDSGVRIVGIVFGTYIIAEKDDTMKIIDFHAAHERFTFDSIMAKDRSYDRQDLVFPEVIELPKTQMADAVAMLDQLQEKGFDVEEFSEDSIVVRGVPSLIKDSSVKEFFKELLEYREDERDPLAEREKRIAARIACHASKRANDYMSRLDMQTIADTALSGKYPLTCPHGRPFLYSMSRAEFEKLFRR